MGARHHDADPLASALDLVGERWTLLIVRELLLGARRFTDLSRAFPGLSRNLLTARLRRLEQEGLVLRRQLPPPFSAQVYEVTEEAWALTRVIAPVAVWGMRRLGPEQSLRSFRAGMFAIGMVAFARLEAAEGVRDTCQFEIAGEVFHIVVADGRIRPREGPAADADVVITTDPQTCIAIMSGTLSPMEAVGEGRMRAAGDPDAARRLLEIFPGPGLPGEPARAVVEAGPL